MSDKKVSARLITAVRIGKVARGILRKTKTFGTSEDPPGVDCIGVEPMLLALSMELALKAWLVFDYGDPKLPRTHNLVQLFDALLQTSQDKLDAEFRSAVAPFHPNPFFDDYSVRSVLYQHQNAFIDWRYYYEGPKHIRFEKGVFEATLEMVLSEFEKRYYDVSG